MLKNGVGRYNIFNFYTKLAESSFLCRFRVESVNVFVCAMCFFFNKQFRTGANALPNYRNEYECMNIARVNIGVLTGWKKIKQRCISFFLGYLRMILWKMSTSIRIKHRILATFDIKKNSILTACMPLTFKNMKFCHDSLVIKNMDVNEHGRISNFTLRN